jgi:hypothetical protein
MRTTIEIPEEQRARLLELAARRGEKGFSKLIQEALEVYLEGERSQAEVRRRALKVRGAFSDRDAEQIRKSTRDIRGSWR